MGSVGILGSGFGLYGYLPALVEAGHNLVLLPCRYKEKFFLRPELQAYGDFIQWISEDNLMFHKVDVLILALPPLQQVDLVEKLIKVKNIKSFLFEKPLANSPYESRKLLDKLILSRKKFRIDYNFRFTSWGGILFRVLGDANLGDKFNRLSISWNFLAPHYRNNKLVWKRFESDGGGALRFYGVHLVALLAEIGYTEVLFSEKFFSNPDEVIRWSASFSGNNLPICDVVVNSKAFINEFSVSLTKDCEKSTLFHGLDPFDCIENFQKFNGQDKRVPYLVNFCRELNRPNASFGWYKNTIELWQLIEDRSMPVCSS